MLSYAVFSFLFRAESTTGKWKQCNNYELQCKSLRPSPHHFRPSRYSLNAATVTRITYILLIVLTAKQKLTSLHFLMRISFFWGGRIFLFFCRVYAQVFFLDYSV